MQLGAFYPYSRNHNTIDSNVEQVGRFSSRLHSLSLSAQNTSKIRNILWWFET